MWSSLETELALKNRIIRNADRLNELKTTFRDGFQYIPLDPERVVLLKLEPEDTRDSLENEYKVGMVINQLRNLSPNFVFTYGRGYSREGSHILLEHVPGVTIAMYKGSFKKRLNFCLQTIFAMDMAYDLIGLTHYNLHRKNVILKKLGRKYLVPYYLNSKLMYFETDRIPVIIDFGRSYTHYGGGHTLESKSVKPKPNHVHDIIYFWNSSLSREYPKELKIILSWYGLEPDSDVCSVIDTLEPKLLSGEELLEKCRKHFGYTPSKSKSKRLPIYRPF
jgi:hypothetical protein